MSVLAARSGNPLLAIPRPAPSCLDGGAGLAGRDNPSSGHFEEFTMPHSPFGWSLPPGCHTLPGDEMREPETLRCEFCGEPLPIQPDSSEWKEDG